MGYAETVMCGVNYGALMYEIWSVGHKPTAVYSDLQVEYKKLATDDISARRLFIIIHSCSYNY